MAWHPLGWRPQFFSEIDPFACAVEAERWPGVPNLGDMAEVDGAAWRGRIDVLVAGTPCQAFSVAGKRGSLADARGNLTLIFCELVHAIDPLCVVWENVPGVLSTSDNAFGCFLAGLVGAGQPLISGRDAGRWPDAGMVVGPQRSAAWRVFDAQYFNLAQRRERVFVVSFHTRDGINPGAVLFEPESVPRHSPPSREAGQRVAASLTRGADSGGKGGYAGRRREDNINLVPELSPAIKARDFKGPSSDGDGDGAPLIPCVTHSLCAGGHDASEDGTGRGTPLVYGLNWQAGGQGAGAHFEEQSGSLIKSQVAGVALMHFKTGYQGDSQPQYAIRRITPREAERLQGFPDDYTLVTYRGKPAADSPRYKALGNSMAVPVLRWIGERIALVHQIALSRSRHAAAERGREVPNALRQ